jgi:predicted phosphodiesterase
VDLYSPQPVRVRSLDEPVDLHCLSDWHVGEHGCAEDTLRRHVAEIARKKRAIVLLGGDLGGFVAPSDRRWDAESVADGVSARDLRDWGGLLVRRVAEIAGPIAPKVIGAIEGNHEASYTRQASVDVHTAICDSIPCRRLGYAAILPLQFVSPSGTETIHIYATHGAGGASQPGGKMSRLRRHMEVSDCDLVIVGHMHEQLSSTRHVISGRSGTITATEQLGVVTGTYLRTYAEGASGYGERAGYAPTPVGHACVTIVPATRAMSVQWVR